MNRGLTIATFFLAAIITSYAQDLNEELKPVKFRNIGPFRGGRSVTASGVIGDPLTYYMGTTGGGLWKTDDAGQRWRNISDGYFGTGSVGAVSVSESDPNVVYCGMGEHAPRGVMTSYGDGVYKSTDAGKTWRKIGLKGTQHISRIIIHPKNPDVVWVAAQGPLHGNSPERGIYKSTDGGESWRKVLYVSENSGASELSIDFSNPQVLYAAMWEHQRLPWKVISGGPGSGLYKSIDGGESWKKIHKGLPEEKGKMAIAVSRANPEKVYALVESDTEKDKGGLFVSKNGGESWGMVSGDNRLVQRAWYYIEVFPDPNDENTVYVLSAPALKSIDGGKTWSRITGTHGDFHDLWINPNNSKNMVIANDGGAAISFNEGKTWSRQDNIPTAQFYRVSVDNVFPYRIYGGQQDNTSVRIESLALGRYQISEQNWTYAAGGESAFLAYDPDNPKTVLGGSYLGTIEALEMDALASTQIMAAPIQYLGMAADEMKYLYNWNAPIIKSQHEPNTYYHAAQLLLRTKDTGVSWEEVSPDLTRNQKDKQGKGGGPYTNEAVGAENYGTIAYVEESSHEAGVIWTGSDDGLVHITRDNAKTWTNVTPKGMEETLVNAIDVSPHEPGTAYIATTRYKFNDHTPAIYKTTNYGKSWTNISEGIPYGAYTRVIREDDVRKDLLFAGTETGVYVSWNGGKKWEPLGLNFPVTPVTDLVIKNGDLVVATAGRSFWILDDVELLRQLRDSKEESVFYTPAESIIGNWGSPLNGNSSDGTDLFKGVNPANGVVFYYKLGDVGDADVTIEIRRPSGELVNSFTSKKDKDFKSYAGGPSAEPVLGKEKGLNRFVWNMRHSSMEGAPTAYIEGSFRGHKAIPGEYKATIKAGDFTQTVDVKILSNPRYSVSAEQYAEFDAFMTEVETNLNEMHGLINKLLTISKRLKKVSEGLGTENLVLKAEAQELLKKLKKWDEDMVQRKSQAYDDVENFPNKFTANYLFMINQSESSLPRINRSSVERRKELDAEWVTLKSRATEMLTTDIPALNKKLWEVGIGALD